jgi:hypothetical protein
MTSTLHGSDQPYPVPTALRAGPLRLSYENGFLRHFRHGGEEVLRMVYFALRDENWGTHAPHLSDETLDIQHDSFVVSYRCHHENAAGEPVFRWNVVIRGEADGSVVFDLTGEALQAIQRNRAGFCVLHPPKSCAGQPVELFHENDEPETTTFPREIAPDDPFLNLTGMRWQTTNGSWYRLEFEGDWFETEDQRNWTDASFKTFCTPLSLPRPVPLQPGDRVKQTVRFRVEEAGSEPAASPTGDLSDDALVVDLTLLDTTTRLPRLGTVAHVGATESEVGTAHLTALNLHHVRVDFHGNRPEAFAAGLQRVKAANSALLAALHLGQDAEGDVQTFLDLVRQHEVAVAGVLLFSEKGPVTDAAGVQPILQTLKAALPDADFGAGTDFNFTEFNRNRFEATGFDFVSFSIHPQEHAFDLLSLVENAEAQGDVVRSASALYPEKPVWVSPVTLRRRFNPYAHHEAHRVVPHEHRTDPRQASLWAAGWTLASLKYLAEGGADTVTFFEDFGERGLMESDGSVVFPVYLLLQEVQRHAGGEVLATATTQPLSVTSLLLRKDGFLNLLLANHGPTSVRLRLPTEMKALSFRLLEETNLAEATTDPKTFADAAGNTLTLAAQETDVLTLPPFALAVGV